MAENEAAVARGWIYISASLIKNKCRIMQNLSQSRDKQAYLPGCTYFFLRCDELCICTANFIVMSMKQG